MKEKRMRTRRAWTYIDVREFSSPTDVVEYLSGKPKLIVETCVKTTDRLPERTHFRRRIAWKKLCRSISRVSRTYRKAAMKDAAVIEYLIQLQNLAIYAIDEEMALLDRMRGRN